MAIIENMDSPKPIFCEHCGTESSTEARFCEKCGTATTSSTPGSDIESSIQKNTVPAGVAKYEIKCANCGYVGVPEPARKIWVSILALLCIIIFWPITLIYFLATPRFRCPQCKSTYVGLKNKQGVFMVPKSGAGVVGIAIAVIVGIAVLGIFASIILASLNMAREKAQQAQSQGSSIAN